jgi:DNA (cytosine-5)-methyltransferase 1
VVFAVWVWVVMMAAYYNEFDPKAAAWLRELIKQGHIADGVVDDRSIEDVTPTELAGFTQCHFFAGIGVWSYALRRAGWADDRPVWTGSCPCQPFSAAGKGAGFDDERHLWPAFHHLISQCQPAIVLGEQVASKDGLGWLDLVLSDLEATGYASGAVDLCAAGVGAPHIRQRLWWVGTRLADATNDVGVKRRELHLQRGWQGNAKQNGVGSEPSNMADTDNARRQLLTDAKPAGIRGEASSERQQVQQSSTDGTSDGSMADASVTGLQGREWVGPTGTEGSPSGHGSECGGLVGLADSTSIGRRASGIWHNIGNDGNQPDADVKDGRPSPTNGHWRDADWLFCRDGKWRPVEPGTFPLAHGSAQRVGRLRGYGNAIVAQAAQAFIESVMGESRCG